MARENQYPGYYYSDGSMSQIGDKVKGTVQVPTHSDTLAEPAIVMKTVNIEGSVVGIRYGYGPETKVLRIGFKLADGRADEIDGFAKDFVKHTPIEPIAPVPAEAAK